MHQELHYQVQRSPVQAPVLSLSVTPSETFLSDTPAYEYVLEADGLGAPIEGMLPDDEVDRLTDGIASDPRYGDGTTPTWDPDDPYTALERRNGDGVQTAVINYLPADTATIGVDIDARPELHEVRMPADEAVYGLFDRIIQRYDKEYGMQASD